MGNVLRLAVKVPRVRILLRVAPVLLLLYVAVYLGLSVFGRYGRMAEGSTTHWTESSRWIPLGFYDAFPPAVSSNSKWQELLMKAFSPLYLFDLLCFLDRRDVYGAATRNFDGSWTIRTNTGVRGGDGKWIYTTNTEPPAINNDSSQH
jgi:hypothetical protein